MTINEKLEDLLHEHVDPVERIASDYDEWTKPDAIKFFCIAQLENLKNDLQKAISTIDEHDEPIKREILDVKSDDDLDEDRRSCIISTLVDDYRARILNARVRMTDIYTLRIDKRIEEIKQKNAAQRAALWAGVDTE